MKGLKDGLGGKASMIVAELPYETSDPTVDSQIINLKASGADIFFNVATPKFAAQAIKQGAEIGWKPVHLLNNVSNSVGSVLKPAGLDNSKGILDHGLSQGPDRSGLEGRSRAQRNGSPSWTSIIPDGDKTSSFTVYGYSRRRRRWCRCSSSAATTSRART